MAQVTVQVRFSPKTRPLILAESLYHEVDEMLLLDFQNRTIECIIDEKEIDIISSYIGVLDVDIVE